MTLLARKWCRSLSLAAALICIGCQSAPQKKKPVDQGPITDIPQGPGLGVAGWIMKRGVMDCFAAGAMRPDKPEKPANCEVSAVVESDGLIIGASDKPVPGQPSSVFEVGMVAEEGRLRLEDRPRGFYKAPTFAALSKVEDMAKTPDGELIFLTTGFDRVKDDGSWDGYNTLLAWPRGQPENAQVINPVPMASTPGASSSVGLRQALQMALADEAFPEGRPYFKVEGLAALPDRRLLFGVRESGPSYKEFEYTIDLIECVYAVDAQGKISIDPGSFVRVYRAPPTRVLGHRVAVSSLAFDAERARLYILLSYEHEKRNDALGGFLASLPLEDLADGVAPEVVRRENDGLPLMFGHKPEGIAVLADRSLLVVHDDDRVTSQKDIGDPYLTFRRGRHQMAFDVIKLALGPAEKGADSGEPSDDAP